MTSAELQPYKMSFAVGGLLLNESVEVARMHAQSEAWDATLQRALDGGVTSLPKAASRRRTLREIVNRISTLDEEELDYLVERADRQDQQALLWLATCRAYRFVREFATEVIHERFLSFQLDLPLESFDVLFAAKAEWDEGLAGISPMTRAKLRQVLFRIMREANVISDDNRILSAYVSPRLKTMLAEKSPRDLVVFPGLSRDGGAL
jgi:BrxA